MQLEPSSIAYTTLVLPIVMIGLKKNLVHPSQPIRFQSKPSHDLTHHVFPRFKWLACFDFEFSLPPWNITQWSGGSSGLLYIHSASKSRTHLWRSGVGYCHDRNFFFHLVNVKVHFRGRLELSLKSICSFRPHKIPLFMLWRGSVKGYQDK